MNQLNFKTFVKELRIPDTVVYNFPERIPVKFKFKTWKLFGVYDKENSARNYEIVKYKGWKWNCEDRLFAGRNRRLYILTTYIY